MSRVERSPGTSSSRNSIQSQDAGALHTVRIGESLHKIAAENGISLPELLASNPQLKANRMVFPGQEIRIPARAQPTVDSAALDDASPRRARRPVRPNADGTFPRGGAAKQAPEGGVDPQRLASVQPSTRPEALSGVDRIIDMTARTEGGGRYDAWNPNDNNHGVSFGLIQFNQGTGSLPTLMRDMHSANPEKFDRIFGPHAQNLLDEGWVRSANLNAPDVKSRMQEAARDPQFQQVQRTLARSAYYEPASRMAEQYGLKSERAHAMLFDSSVQNGVGGTQRFLREAAAGGGSERDILQRFAGLADANRWSGNRRTHLLSNPSLSDGPVGSARPSGPTPPDIRPMATYTVRVGDSLGGIANRHGTTWQELARANNISNPNIIQPGQVLQLPGSVSLSQPNVPAPQLTAGQYDGRTPAPGTTSTRAWIPVDAPLTNGVGNRSADAYAQTLNQFGVGTNLRYAPRDGNTYCNIFVWDATRAMGGEIPHWVDGAGNATGVGQGRELDANGTNRWLHEHGAAHGWRRVDAAEAQQLANDGHPSVASWRNPSGIGHIGMVRPGELASQGPALAQAGSRNFNNENVADGFGNRTVEYWVHP